MILRYATTNDEPAVESFDLGDTRSAWLDEVAEIVSGLIAWRDDVEHLPLDRLVVIAGTEGEIVAVAAHERVEHERLGPLSEHRYLMVVAARADYRRSGVARVLTESVFAGRLRDGVRTVRWLVHPANLASIGPARLCSQRPTRPTPEDRPYVSFLLAL